MAQWITRLPTEQKIPGSSPGKVALFFLQNFLFFSTLGLQYRGNAFFSGEGLPLTDPTLEYAWMQEVEIGKISGDAPLDSLINIFLWLDQLIITVDDHASMFVAPREFIIGDEMKVRVKIWLRRGGWYYLDKRKNPNILNCKIGIYCSHFI